MGMGIYGAMDHGVSVRIPPWGYWGLHGTSKWVRVRSSAEEPAAKSWRKIVSICRRRRFFASDAVCSNKQLSAGGRPEPVSRPKAIFFPFLETFLSFSEKNKFRHFFMSQIIFQVKIWWVEKNSRNKFFFSIFFYSNLFDKFCAQNRKI